MGSIATITPNPLLCAVHVFLLLPSYITKSTLLPQHLISPYLVEEQIVGVADYCHSCPYVYFSQPTFITKSTILRQHLISPYLVEEQIVGVADICHFCPLEYPSD